MYAKRLIAIGLAGIMVLTMTSCTKKKKSLVDQSSRINEKGIPTSTVTEISSDVEHSKTRKEREKEAKENKKTSSDETLSFFNESDENKLDEKEDP